MFRQNKFSHFPGTLKYKTCKQCKFHEGKKEGKEGKEERSKGGRRHGGKKGRKTMRCVLEMSVAKLVFIFELLFEQYYNFENHQPPFLSFFSSSLLIPEIYL